MKAREILNFVLTGYVSVELCGVINVSKGEDAGQYFPGLCDSLDFDKDCTYFWFWTDNEDKETDIKEFLSYSNDDPLLKFADIELPTEDGWYILFSFED